MLTPQEVKSRAFQRASFGGYNMAQVDEFLDILTEDYSALYNDNAVLKSKMKVLVDKVEEYRSTEEAMRKALMTAQRMADDLVREAEQKKANILKEAEEKTASRVKELDEQIRAEEWRLHSAQENTAAFVEQMRSMYAEQVKFLARLEDMVPEQAIPAPVDPVEEAVSDIDDSVQRLLAKAMAEATAENMKARIEEEAEEYEEDLSDTAEFAPITQADLEKEPEDLAKTSVIDFGELQFGRDYEIK